ncbi:MAG: N-acetylmuramoyl-L-alanine amidase [Terriglobales bacterium]
MASFQGWDVPALKRIWNEILAFHGPDSARMSANPNRVDWESTASPLQEGNRVLESIAQQETLRALLAFSSLHEQIRNRRSASGRAADRDLFETERFILDEVLQLICARAQAITQADGIVVALADRSDMVCRAASGPFSIECGVHLIASEFLQDCLESGRILRCDDCEIDARVEHDVACELGACSTVLVPLRGRREQLGVLQAFSRTPWAFTDRDIRCFDLFAELVLAALRPEDQDRRAHWLSNVADDVLRVKPGATLPVDADPAIRTTAIGLETGLVPSSSSSLATSQTPPPALPVQPVEEQPAVISPALDFHETDVDDEDPVSHESERELANLAGTPPFLERLSRAGGSHPGLSVVLGLMVVAALFSAGAWWGMQEHRKAPPTRVADTRIAPPPRTETTAPAPTATVQSPTIPDNLMSSEQLGADAAPLIAVPGNKLAGLPKVTGVRHWSSSTGSTVVVDMQDQAPYEVHRLMSPERIYFDLHNTLLSPELNGKTIEVGDALLTRVRIGQPVAGVTRVVLDTKDGSNFSVSMESNPYRLIVELRASEKTSTSGGIPPNEIAPNASATNPPSIPVDALQIPAKTAPVASLAAKASDQPLPARSGKFRIVLDAGHGGWDLGTVGRQGLLEKDLVLDVTQRLGKLLKARLGSEVMLTRSADTYLPLEQRSDFANQAQADLFVSVHANYSSSAAARGVETYYTNLFSAPGSREVERHDDGTFTKPTPVTLSADGLHEKIEESRRLAASVQRSLYATLAARSPDIRNRGIKDSAFAVLTGTTMPSILTEISFVSSPADEHNLQTAAYRQQIAEALYQGIARYQQASPRMKVAQLQKAAAR